MNDMKEQAHKSLKAANSQLTAALKMSNDDRYCVDISYQILATISLLKKANEQLLMQHLTHCVADAFKEGNEEEKIKEVAVLMSKLID